MSRATILASRQAFSDWGIWPKQRADVNPEGWLANFDDEDSDIAEALLDAFVYFNGELTEQLFLSACLSVSARFPQVPTERGRAWRDFRKNGIVTFPGQEDQNPVDSGHDFARMARDRMGFVEGHLYRPADACRALAKLDEGPPLVVVDDFVGSGDQFLGCWTEQVLLHDNVWTSLQEEVRRLQLEHCYLVVAAATQTGIDDIQESAPEIKVIAAHTLPKSASLLDPSSPALPDGVHSRLAPFVEKYSRKAGIRDDLWGFRDLALAIGFERSTPDASLPLYWYESDTWTPLRRRR